MLALEAVLIALQPKVLLRSLQSLLPRRPCPIAGIFLFLSLFLPGQSYGVTNLTSQQSFYNQIEQHRQKLLPHQQLIKQQFQRNRPTVQQILEQLAQNQLPKELALLPMIESTFNASAISPANAAGLWQLMPETAKRFGLIVNHQKDERFDIQRSSEAAIAYLGFLYKKFDRDITLTLAAYNAGEGRVQRALKQQDGKDFPSLRLPRETINYVHKFYALMDLVNITDFNRAIPFQQSKNAFQQAAKSKLPPLGIHQKVLLAELFETRQIIDMKPIKPLFNL